MISRLKKSKTFTSFALRKEFSFLLLFCLLGTYGCKNNVPKAETIEAEIQDAQQDESVVEIPEDFLPFYTKFHNDPSFQLTRIIFPLQGRAEDRKWEMEDWEIHKPYVESPEFKRSFSNFKNIITETIVHSKGLFSYTKRFSKISGEWYLIYYEGKNNLDGFKATEGGTN